MSTTPAIELNGLTKRFGDVTALQGLDLTVEQGEIFGFLGPNGAGKSTTINILLDFVRPTQGEATVLGLDAQEQSEAVRQQVGVLSDGYQVYERLTGRQHLEFAIRSKETDDDPDAILERMGIPDAGDRKAGGYSKGMKQRLVLGMALVGDPDLLILDEPTTGLDPNGAREMRDIIRAEADRGATVFFSSHILEQVEAVCDRVSILSEGQLVALDTIEGLRNTLRTDAAMTVELDRALEDRSTVAGVDGVSGVTVDGTSLTVRCSNDAKIDALVALHSAGYDVRNLETTEVSLEELFAELTGKDAAAAGSAEVVR